MHRFSWQRALIGLLIIANALPYSLDVTNRTFSFGLVCAIIGLAVLAAPLPNRSTLSFLDIVRIICIAVCLASFMILYNRAPTGVSIALAAGGTIPMFIPWSTSGEESFKAPAQEKREVNTKQPSAAQPVQKAPEPKQPQPAATQVSEWAKRREEKKREQDRKRAGTVMREFSVSGVSRHQEVFEEAGHLNEEYFYSKSRLEKEDLLYVDIPKYLFDRIDLTLELDEENKYDKNAVKVFINDEHIGFIPAEDSKYVHDMIETDRVADIDASVVGGPLKRYDEIEDEIEEVDLYFGLRIRLYIRENQENSDA